MTCRLNCHILTGCHRHRGYIFKGRFGCSASAMPETLRGSVEEGDHVIQDDLRLGGAQGSSPKLSSNNLCADSISLLPYCSCRTSAADQADDALLAHGLPGAAAYGSRLDASSKLLTGAPQESVLRRWLNMHQASPSSVSLAQQALSLS